MRALITGIAGFVGSHLADFLLHHTACQVWGIQRDQGDGAHLPPSVHLLTGDVRDRDAVVAFLHAAQPDLVFHLAAQTVAPASWADPWDTLETNIRGQLNILAALADLGWPTRALVVGSEHEYGAVASEDLPIDEATPLRPTSPYAVSKVAQDMLGLQYHLSHGVNAIRVRPFPHIGPRQRPDFAASAFAQQIAEAEAGLRAPVVRVGNLDAERDYTDVRDTVRAYWLLMQHGTPGEVYNVGSGVARSVRSLLDGLLALSRVPLRVEVEAARLRRLDVPRTVCDPTRLHAATGWRPTIPFDQTLRDILDDWRERVVERAVGSTQAT